MPPGRKPDFDKRIANLIAELQATLVQREQARIAAEVSRQVGALVRGLEEAAKRPVAAVRGATTGRRTRKPRSPESRALQARKMKAYWAARKAAESGGGKVKKAKKEAPAAGGEATKG